MTKGKRKIVQAATSGKKAPGARKPRKKKEVWNYPQKCSQWPPKDLEPHHDGGLTHTQALFVDAYVDNGGNATDAYQFACPHVTRASAAVLGCLALNKEHVVDAIDKKHVDIRRRLNLPREKLLRIQAAMATAKLSEFAEVLRDPRDKESYRNLGDSEWALQGADHSYENGNKIKLCDRQAALDELWKKLGYEKTDDSGRERDVTGSVHARIRELNGKGSPE